VRTASRDPARKTNAFEIAKPGDGVMRVRRLGEKSPASSPSLQRRRRSSDVMTLDAVLRHVTTLRTSHMTHTLTKSARRPLADGSGQPVNRKSPPSA
jgi:hypothetical protein